MHFLATFSCLQIGDYRADDVFQSRENVNE